MDKKTVSLKEIKDFFGYKTLKAFSDDWKLLDENSRRQIRQGLEDGTYTY